MSNIQLADINYKPHGGRDVRENINYAIIVHFYPPPGSEH